MSSTGKTVVIDSSALLALIDYEPGWQFMQSSIAENHCLMSSVNLSEFVAKLVERNSPLLSELEVLFRQLEVEVIDFTTSHATEAGLLRKKTRSKGLSLGDRACIALALETKAPILTSDQIWQTLRLPVSVVNIRVQALPE